jgi:hypothetical protein
MEGRNAMGRGGSPDSQESACQRALTGALQRGAIRTQFCVLLLMSSPPPQKRQVEAHIGGGLAQSLAERIMPPAVVSLVQQDGVQLVGTKMRHQSAGDEDRRT